jgi:hypothetical protein
VRVCHLFVLCALLGAGCVDLARPSALRDAGPPRADARDVAQEAPPRDLVDQDTPDDSDVDEPDVEPDADVPDAGAPDLAPETSPLDDGRACDQDMQCASGICAQGVCCHTACAGTCMACNLAPSPGQCTPVVAGEDPLQQCAPDLPASCGLDGTCDGKGACRRYPIDAECAAGGCLAGVEHAASTCDGNGTCRPGMMRNCASGMCMGASCASPCTKSTECQSGFFCDAGKCALKRANAAACSAAEQCASGSCVQGVCCNSLCGELCFACNLVGTVGMCKPVPAGQDPRSQCPSEAASTCGRAGGCNGAGACRLHPVNTVCGPTTCTGSTETAARTCDGLGVCRPPQSTRTCSPYTCGPAACATTCADSSTCAPAFGCQASLCVPIPNLALYWRFEETAGTTAVDSSGNGRVGTYIGGTGPVPSTDLPPLMYPNASSRLFAKAARNAVQLQTDTAALQPTNDLTVSAWYRATRTDSQGSEIVSGWNGYVLRLRPTFVEWSKRINGVYVQCQADPGGFLDGRWHHVAGVISRVTGLKLYFDGVEICSMPQKDDISYNAGADGLFVGRHGDGQDVWDFDGNIDEVRIYTRPLSPAEITTLAQGRNN